MNTLLSRKRPRPGADRQRETRKAGHGTAPRYQGHRHDVGADGPVRLAVARRHGRRRRQGRGAAGRPRAPDRSGAPSRDGPDLPQHQSQQAQRRRRPQEAGRPRRRAAPARRRRRADLQRPPERDGPARPRLRDRRGDQPARRLRRPVRLRPGRAVRGAAGVRRPDPGRRDPAAPDLGGEQGPAALRAVRDGRSHRRPDGSRRHPRRAARPRAHRPRPAPRRADVRDHGRLRSRRPSRRPQLRPAARRRRLRAPALARAAPLPHERRLHLRAGLQRQAVAGLPARHRPRVAAAGRRALRDLRQSLAQHRLRLRRAGADLRAAQHCRMDGAARGGRRADDADARPEERARRPAPRRDEFLHDQRAPDRGPGPLDADADDVFRKHARGGAPRAPPRRAQRRGADAGRLQRRGDRRLDRPGRRPDLERGARWIEDPHELRPQRAAGRHPRRDRQGLRALRRRLLVRSRPRRPLSRGVLPRSGRRRLARHVHRRAVRRLGPRHHRGGDHDADDRAVGRRHVGAHRRCTSTCSA